MNNLDMMSDINDKNIKIEQTLKETIMMLLVIPVTKVTV